MKHKNLGVLLFIIVMFSSCTYTANIEQSIDDYSLLDIADEPIVNQNRNKPKSPSVQHLLTTSSSEISLGIDISHYQGNLLNEIKPEDSVRFLICKATQGEYYVDPDFRFNWREISERGLIRGAYHFYVCDIDPIVQAKHFARTISDISSTDIAPILDIEQGSMSNGTSPKKMESDIIIFLKEVENILSRKPILYTDYAFANEYLKNPEFAKYDLWLAEYTGAEQPKIPTTWVSKGFKIWQRSEKYSVDHRKTDLDVFYGPLHKIIK
jgi:lysozyme